MKFQCLSSSFPRLRLRRAPEKQKRERLVVCEEELVSFWLEKYFSSFEWLHHEVPSRQAWVVRQFNLDFYLNSGFCLNREGQKNRWIHGFIKETCPSHHSMNHSLKSTYTRPFELSRGFIMLLLKVILHNANLKDQRFQLWVLPIGHHGNIPGETTESWNQPDSLPTVNHYHHDQELLDLKFRNQDFQCSSPGNQNMVTHC